MIWAVIVVTFSTSFVMGVNTGGPSLYNGVKSFTRMRNSLYAISFSQFITPWLRGYPFPCQKEGSTSQWIATVWSGCDYIHTASKNHNGYYYLPAVPASQHVIQNFLDSLHGIVFVIGAAVGGFTGQYWYLYLTRFVSNRLASSRLLMSISIKQTKRSSYRDALSNHGVDSDDLCTTDLSCI